MASEALIEMIREELLDSVQSNPPTDEELEELGTKPADYDIFDYVDEYLLPAEIELHESQDDEWRAAQEERAANRY